MTNNNSLSKCSWISCLVLVKNKDKFNLSSSSKQFEVPIWVHSNAKIVDEMMVQKD